MKKRLVLASSSPRRRELLEQAGLAFVVVPANIEEDMRPPRGGAAALVKKLALQKAAAVALRHPRAVVLGADTVVSSGRHLWSKPESKKEARMMLRTLSGKTHDIWTGFCIIDAVTGRRVVCAEKTLVTFRMLTNRDIDRYITTGEYDGAGAYQLQRGGNILTARIEGDYNNVVGLPLDATLKELKKFGIRP